MNITCKYQLVVALLLLANISIAKEGTKPVPATTTQFIHNAGQITNQHGEVRSDIDFKIENGGVTMFGGDGQLHYQWTKTPPAPLKGSDKTSMSSAGEHPPLSPFEGEIEDAASSVEMYRMDVTLVRANKNAQMVFEEPTGYYENYYLAHTGENGVVAKGYNRVTYKNVYPGIDWVIYTPPVPLKGREVSQGVKYDFVVHPGGNPADIRLRYDGATELKLVDGALVAVTPFGTITEDAPYSYEVETKNALASKYLLQGNELRFDVGQYEGTLVIDPTLNWATYYGGIRMDVAQGVSTDRFNNIYVCGGSWSTSNIATTGAFQTVLFDQVDAMLVKFNEAGTRIWATYYGGIQTDDFETVAISGDTAVFVAGEVYSNGLATTGAHQTTLSHNNGGYDVMLVKFNNNGNRIWATYYGGQRPDEVRSVKVNSTGDVYIVGQTGSLDSIATQGAHQSTRIQTNFFAGFIAKFNQNGVRLWGTYYGLGEKHTGIEGIDFDANNNCYIAGYSWDTAGIASNGSFQTALASQMFVHNADGFIAKFNNNGVRQWGTYYGGTHGDWFTDISISPTGEIYCVGDTWSNNMATANVVRPVLAGQQNIFVTKFTTNGQRIWGTYLGGNYADYGLGIKYHPTGRLYIMGYTYSTSGITTNNAYQTNFAGGSRDVFFMSIDTAATTQYYGTYYGGGGNDIAYTAAFGKNGHYYVVGYTNSTSGIATTGAHQATYTDTNDAFLADFIIDTLAYFRYPFKDTVVCRGDSLFIPYGVAENFNSNNVFTLQLSDATGSFASPVDIGTLASNVADTIGCRIPLVAAAGSAYRMRIVSSSPVRISEDNGVNIRLKDQPANMSCSNNNPCAEDTLRLTGATTSTGVTWAWTGPNSFAAPVKDTFIANSTATHSGDYILKATLTSTGCAIYDTTTVVIKPRPDKPVASSNSPVCQFYSLQLTTNSATTGVSYSWTGPNGYSNSTQNPTVTNSASSIHAGDYISTATLNGCSRKDTVTAVVLPKPAIPTATAPNSPLCARQNLQLNAATIAGATYNWYGVAGYTANTQNPTRNYIQLNEAGKYYVYATLNGCISDTDSVTVVVNTDPVVNIFPTPGAVICPGKQVIFTAVPTNGGATGYQWYVNGAATGVSTLAYSTTTLNNNDRVYCLMVSTGTCATPFTDTSNEITMTVKQALAPKVVITADAGPSLYPNEPINFTAVATDAGNTPNYQWRKNGIDIGGATGAVWGANANALKDGDNICVLVTSTYACPNPDTALSNCIQLDIRLSVDEVVNSNSIKVYPNPVKGTLRITSTTTIETITINNLLGQQLMQQTANGNTADADMSALPAGVYVVKVNGVYAVRVTKE